MKQLNLLLFFFFSSVSLFSQSDQKWFSYWNADTTLLGFKNAKGEILTEPKFIMVSCSDFEKVSGVVEQVSEDEYKTYYLRNNGTKFAEDSVYFFDAAADNEHEGYIRFKSPKTKKVGLMDINGKIILPAVYDEMKPVEFGFVRALKGAKKDFWEEHEDDGCGHFSWVGGESQLISIENGKVLSSKFLMDKKGEHLYEDLDYSTFEKSKKPSTDSLRMSFKAKGGGYISFMSLGKSFDQWINQNFFQQPDELQFRKIIADSLVLWVEDEGWGEMSKEDLFFRKENEITDFIELINSNQYEHFSMSEDFFLYDVPMFKKYYTSCMEFDAPHYPYYCVVVTNKNSDEQSHLQFLRTDIGWQLVCLTLR
jgi:hypothetical protein